MEVNRICIVGAGLRGQAIAFRTAAAGYPTVLLDISGEAIERAMASIRKLVEATGSERPAAEQSGNPLDRIQEETYLPAAVREADLVIEAIPEHPKAKYQLLELLDKAAPQRTILASTTSSLSLTELASATRRPTQFLGMHFCPPVDTVPLVELVQTLETSAETTNAAEAVGARIGKEVVRVRDCPGSIAARANALLTNEAFFMLEQGVAPAADIDRAIRLSLSQAMGPLELADLVGLDNRLRVLENLHKALGEKFRPCPLLAQYVHSGRLGRKSGRGVYDYSTEKTAPPGD